MKSAAGIRHRHGSIISLPHPGATSVLLRCRIQAPLQIFANFRGRAESRNLLEALFIRENIEDIVEDADMPRLVRGRD